MTDFKLAASSLHGCLFIFMKEKPHLKAYFIKWLPENNEAVVMGWMEAIVCAENEKLARLETLSRLREYDIEEDKFGNPFTYISIQLKRSPEYDKFFVDGRIKSREDIEYDRKRKERDEGFKQLLADNPSAFAYILKGGYYYKPDCCGYTEFQTYAGVYTLAFAVNHCLGMSLGDYMRPILIDISEHNKMVSEQIEGLKTRLITV